MNQALFVGVMILVWGFQSSANLASAYGFAVTATMLMTTMLAFVVLPRGSTGLRRVRSFY